MSNPRLKKSYLCALNGLFKILIREPNIKIHFIVALLVVIAIIFYNLSRLEAAIIIAFITLVFIAEIFNTILEKLINKLHPHYDEQIGRIKDAMAGAVLVSVIMAVIVGTTIFITHVQGSVLNVAVGVILLAVIIIVTLLSIIL